MENKLLRWRQNNRGTITQLVHTNLITDWEGCVMTEYFRPWIKHLRSESESKLDYIACWILSMEVKDADKTQTDFINT